LRKLAIEKKFDLKKLLGVGASKKPISHHASRRETGRQYCTWDYQKGFREVPVAPYFL
jgi:hypothetical protein